MCQLLNLGHFETSKSNFKKNCQSRIENIKLEKGWFGSRWSNFTLWDGQKVGAPEPFYLSLSHFSELSGLSYLIWKRGFRAICWSKIFEFFQPNRYFLNLFLSGSRGSHRSSRFWSLTQSLPLAYGATIPHMKGDCHIFHMRYSSMICGKRLQSDRPHNLLSVLPLV